MVAAYDIGLSTDCRLHNVKDLTANGLFLVATGAEIILTPSNSNNLHSAKAETLRSAKGSDI